MWTNNLPLRVAGLTVLMSFLVLGLCIAAVVVLIYQQAHSDDNLREDVSSSQGAHEMKGDISDLLLALLKNRKEELEPLNRQIHTKLDRARELADKGEEQELVSKLEKSFADYQSQIGTPDATRIVESELLPTCVRLQEF